VHRVFTLAAQVLSEISSPLVRLRAMVSEQPLTLVGFTLKTNEHLPLAQLHFEVAKCELSSDFLAKASKHVTDCINQDYGEIDEKRVIEPEKTLDEPEFFPVVREPTLEVSERSGGGGGGRKDNRPHPPADRFI